MLLPRWYFSLFRFRTIGAAAAATQLDYVVDELDLQGSQAHPLELRQADSVARSAPDISSRRLLFIREDSVDEAASMVF